MIYRILSILGLILIIAVGVFLVDRGPNSPTVRAANARTTGDMGYAALNAEIVETGDDGRPLYTLSAGVIRQSLNSEVVNLEDVRMEFHGEEGNVWTARADYGQILEDAAHVHLTGAVSVSGVLPGSQEPARITTDRLSFDTRAEVVRTQSPVTLDWSGRTLRGRGLVASLKANTVRLESNVHGSFSP